jgi:hypothetical protein
MIAEEMKIGPWIKNPRKESSIYLFHNLFSFANFLQSSLWHCYRTGKNGDVIFKKMKKVGDENERPNERSQEINLFFLPRSLWGTRTP